MEHYPLTIAFAPPRALQSPSALRNFTGGSASLHSLALLFWGAGFFLASYPGTPYTYGMAAYFLDLESGNDANDGTSFAQRVKTWSRASAVMPGPGDTLRIMASATPASLGVTGAWVKGAFTVTLSAAVNKDIEPCNALWTPSANVTTSLSTTRREGTASANIVIAAGFVTGKAAYRDLGAAMDFSAFEQVSLWFANSNTAGVNNLTLVLCSDATGDVAVNTLAFPSNVVANNVNQPVVLNNAAPLGSAIRSVALYVTSDLGAQTVNLDNIFACKAASDPACFTLKHCFGFANSIGAGGTDADTWFVPMNVRETVVTLDAVMSASITGLGRGYFPFANRSETVYAFIPSFVANAYTANDGVFASGGSAAAHSIISGGWNRTDMSTQTGQTFLGVPHATTGLIALSMSGSYYDISRLHFARSSPFQFAGNVTTFGETHFISSISVPFSLTGSEISASMIVLANYNSASVITGFDNDATILSFALTAAPATITNTISSTFIFDDDSDIALFAPPDTGSRTTVTYRGVTYGQSATEADLDAMITAQQFTANALANAPVGGGFDPDADEVVTGVTFTEWARIIGATTAGKLSGAGTVTETFRGIDDASNVVTATVDASGNRSAITYNP